MTWLGLGLGLGLGLRAKVTKGKFQAISPVFQEPLNPWKFRPFPLTQKQSQVFKYMQLKGSGVQHPILNIIEGQSTNLKKAFFLIFLSCIINIIILIQLMNRVHQ